MPIYKKSEVNTIYEEDGSITLVFPSTATDAEYGGRTVPIGEGAKLDRDFSINLSKPSETKEGKKVNTAGSHNFRPKVKFKGNELGEVQIGNETDETSDSAVFVASMADNKKETENAVKSTYWIGVGLYPELRDYFYNGKYSEEEMAKIITKYSKGLGSPDKPKNFKNKALSEYEARNNDKSVPGPEERTKVNFKK